MPDRKVELMAENLGSLKFWTDEQNNLYGEIEFFVPHPGLEGGGLTFYEKIGADSGSPTDKYMKILASFSNRFSDWVTVLKKISEFDVQLTQMDEVTGAKKKAEVIAEQVSLK